MVTPASVTGVQKLNPCGTAVAGKVLPREKSPLEWVPRVVRTQSTGSRGGSGRSATRTSSSQPVISPGASVRSTIRLIRRPANAPSGRRTRFHWSTHSVLSSSGANPAEVPSANSTSRLTRVAW